MLAVRPPRQLRPVHHQDDRHAVVETSEHETIEIEGCSHDEVEAKLHDLDAWAT